MSATSTHPTMPEIAGMCDEIRQAFGADGKLVPVITAQPTQKRADGTMGGPYQYSVEYIKDQTDEWEGDREGANARRGQRGVSKAAKGSGGAAGVAEPELSESRWWD